MEQKRKPVDLDAWLRAHPSIAASIVWEGPGTAELWVRWSSRMQDELEEAFQLALAGGSVLVKDVPPNLVSLADDETPTTILAQEDAWAYYRASVGLGLALEVDRQLPWTLLEGYTLPALTELFDSRAMFRWNGPKHGYEIKAVFGRIVPAPPARSLAFLRSVQLIGATRLETIARVLDWCGRLTHFSGYAEAANMEAHWQYRGVPPMSRVLTGTVNSGYPSRGIRHYTAGCWGTVGFLRALLRAANIPVKLTSAAGHAMPWFVADGRHLSHGDDPYNQFVTHPPRVPAAALLIDEAMFDRWFGARLSDRAKEQNVARGAFEAAVRYASGLVLTRYCAGLATSKERARQKVEEELKSYFTPAQLEAAGLWDRIEQRLAQLGGCGKLPRP